MEFNYISEHKYLELQNALKEIDWHRKNNSNVDVEELDVMEEQYKRNLFLMKDFEICLEANVLPSSELVAYEEVRSLYYATFYNDGKEYSKIIINSSFGP